MECRWFLTEGRKKSQASSWGTILYKRGYGNPIYKLWVGLHHQLWSQVRHWIIPVALCLLPSFQPNFLGGSLHVKASDSCVAERGACLKMEIWPPQYQVCSAKHAFVSWRPHLHSPCGCEVFPKLSKIVPKYLFWRGKSMQWWNYILCCVFLFF